MKTISLTAVLFVVAAAIILSLSGCASATPKPLTEQQADYPADKVDARGVFLENCATCHGENGRATTFHGILLSAQNLTDVGFQSEVSDEQIRQAIKTGPASMPAFEKKLSASEIDALVLYVRSLKAAE
ncbi:MAG TPA: cytochrome c [Verrucomicrobiae bacterium]|nr:cytochrome c [Verrucomicrobiae bacterium]